MYGAYTQFFTVPFETLIFSSRTGLVVRLW